MSLDKTQYERKSTDHLLENGLPANIEAERSILGAILLDNAVCNQAIELLRREDFFLDSHRRIFNKMVALTERAMPIDLITLSEELRRAGEFEQIGGATYIASLIDGVPRTDNIEPYARIIKSKSSLRQVLNKLNYINTQILDRAEDDESLLNVVRDESIRLQEWLESSAIHTKFKVLHGNELDNLPSIEWLIPGEIPMRGHVEYYGQSGGGKSFVALDRAFWIAQSKPVVYVIGEGLLGIKKRKLAWCKYHKRDVGQFYYLPLPVNLLDSNEVNEFIAAIRKINPVAVFFDTKARCMPGGDDGQGEDISIFNHALGMIQQRVDAATVSIHHTGWNETRVRGHSSQLAACDVQIRISNEDGMITLECNKQKDDTPFAVRSYRLVKVEVTENESSCVLVPTEKMTAEFGKVTNNQRKILEVLNFAVFEKIGARSKAIIDQSKLPASSVYSIISDLLKRQLVKQTEKGQPFFITDAGKRAIGQDDSVSLPDSNSFNKANALNNKAGTLFELSNHSKSHSESGSNPSTVYYSNSLASIEAREWSSSRVEGKTLFDEGPASIQSLTLTMLERKFGVINPDAQPSVIPDPLPIDVIENCFNGGCSAVLEFKRGLAYCSRCGVHQRIVS